LVRHNLNFEKSDYSDVNNGICTTSVWCIFCYGTGLRRHRASGIDPRIDIKTCSRCKGRKRIWVRKGSDLERAGSSIVPGLYPGIRKSKR